ncbi:hypothetical protein BGX31_009277 [Mortierella sp. GBA43]|nr:hypothetical protein BGX31_009277 [Mortierella sp. GBA43]
MVKHLHVIAAMAAVVASVTAAPYGDNPMRSFSGTIVSKMFDIPFTVGARDGAGELTMCVVTSDTDCDIDMPSDYIRENVEY